MTRQGGRALRVSKQLLRELAVLLRDEVKDPRVTLVTLTDAELSPDLEHAKVFFSSLAPQGPEVALEGLRHAAPFLRSQLGRRLKLRTTPELHFALDTSIENGVRLSRLIDEAVASDRKLPGRDGGDD
ncbi:MAG: 30S ribosome-binding factor RbfA [Pseudomonadota bacterium]